MKKPQSLTATVHTVTAITPHMHRIVFKSEAFTHYPADCEGGYIKLLFTPTGETDLTGLNAGEKPVMRTYTIRSFVPQQQTIDVDFVLHNTSGGKGGFGSHWAMTAKPGDTISIIGPGLLAALNPETDYYFFAADMTALPAMSVKLKQLPADAIGCAVIEIKSQEDIQSLIAPEQFDIDWVVTNEEQPDQFSQVVRSKPWPLGLVSVWCACEFETMRDLRQYFRNERQVGRDYIYISSYWKDGVTEDGHKVIKQQDAKTNQSM